MLVQSPLGWRQLATVQRMLYKRRKKRGRLLLSAHVCMHELLNDPFHTSYIIMILIIQFYFCFIINFFPRKSPSLGKLDHVRQFSKAVITIVQSQLVVNDLHVYFFICCQHYNRKCPKIFVKDVTIVKIVDNVLVGSNGCL